MYVHRTLDVKVFFLIVCLFVSLCSFPFFKECFFREKKGLVGESVCGRGGGGGGGRLALRDVRTDRSSAEQFGALSKGAPCPVSMTSAHSWEHCSLSVTVLITSRALRDADW